MEENLLLGGEGGGCLPPANNINLMEHNYGGGASLYGGEGLYIWVGGWVPCIYSMGGYNALMLRHIGCIYIYLALIWRRRYKGGGRRSASILCKHGDI